MVGIGTLVAVTVNSTVADPGCVAGKSAILDKGNNIDDPATLQSLISDLNAAAAKAKHDNVRQALKNVAEDYTQVQTAEKTGQVSPNIEQKATADLNQIDKLCTIGK
jgi:hypothetical protein